MKWQRKTKSESKIHIYVDIYGNEFHTIYLWYIERPKNKLLNWYNPRYKTKVFRKQPLRHGFNRKGRIDGNT